MKISNFFVNASHTLLAGFCIVHKHMHAYLHQTMFTRIFLKDIVFFHIDSETYLGYEVCERYSQNFHTRMESHRRYLIV